MRLGHPGEWGDHHSRGGVSRANFGSSNGRCYVVKDRVLDFGSDFAAKSTGLTVLRTQHVAMIDPM
jgi:hypothetical protein